MTSIRHSGASILWGKSNAGGTVNLLVQHLFDAAAVGEQIWANYLATTVKDRLDACVNGQGRQFFALLCGLHDVGKATPAFQAKHSEWTEWLRAADLTWGALNARARRWHHTCAGALIVWRALEAAGWSTVARDWVWPLVAGHHGLVPDEDILILTRDRSKAQGCGQPAWAEAQDAVVHIVADALGISLAALAPTRVPRRAEQLAISGAIIMADWIASGQHFPGIADPPDVSMTAARERAARAWQQLGIRGGWSPSSYTPVDDLIECRFDRLARPAQRAAIELAEQMPTPGLLIVEAPMGDGKTELALAAAEILARRFRADGVCVCMPTQATCDPMFHRTRRWSSQIDPEVPVALLHGKARFNREWASLRREVHFDGVDDLGCDDLYGTGSAETDAHPDQAPAEWCLGRNRGLLVPVVVATIDQLLHAMTRTKHVMLRHTGLAGRVVILDEVHAYDVYMSEFLFEALRWLADASVPVIVLSATVPPSTRHALMRAYLQGASAIRDVTIEQNEQGDGYPAVRSVCVADGRIKRQERIVSAARRPVPVNVSILDEGPADSPDAVASLVCEQLADGGCALIIRNTVKRARDTYLAVKARLGPDQVVLLHARLDAGSRADRTESVLNMLGSPDHDDTAARPHTYVVVATQVAEQSFDIDADLLVTDLAPIDLLLQRVGRLHRHDREARPALLRTAQLVVAGMRRNGRQPPSFPHGSVYVYSQYALLRAASLVIEALDRGWQLPSDIPKLVRRGYEDESAITPQEWSDTVERSREAWASDMDTRRGRAQPFLLAGADMVGTSTLAGLHNRASGEPPDEEAAAAVVRDGPESVEVVLVRRDPIMYRTLAGRPLGPNGSAVSDPDVADEVSRGTVRLPGRPEVTAAAKSGLRPLPGWDADPWLGKARALVLDHTNSVELGGRSFSYDPELGLIDEELHGT